MVCERCRPNRWWQFAANVRLDSFVTVAPIPEQTSLTFAVVIDLRSEISNF